MSIKIISIIKCAGIVLIIALVIFGLKSSLLKKDILSSQHKIKVVTTLYPLFHFTKQIGGEFIDTILLIPPGVEPHSFEPKPRDMMILNEADLFIYTGPLMETWVEDILKGVSNPNLVVVNASRQIKLIPAVFHEKSDGKEGLDPHIWLGLNNDLIIIDEITNGLIRKDKKNSLVYLKKAKEYKQNLESLDSEYKAGLSNCKKRTIVYGGHYTFGYLAKNYKLNYVAAQGISSDAEPTIADLSNLVELVKIEKIPYIFYQELSSPKVAETIAQETGTQMLLLNGAHTVTKQDFERDISFIEIMKNNLLNLRKGLDCN